MAISVGEMEATLRLRDELTQKLRDVQRQLGSAGVSLQKIGTDVRAAGAAFLPFSLAVGTAAAGVFKAAVDFESSFAGVRKTVDATEPEFQQLAQGFRDLSKEIPINVNELNRIGEAAGQLGIRTANILDFTDVIAKLGVTTNLSADEAATSLARFANVMDATAVAAGTFEFDRLGATIVDLGNKFATTEREIVEFGQRLAGAGKIAGLTEAQVLGIGAAMSSVGVEAEAGGTAVQKVLNQMTEAVATGNSSLKVFAETAGLSAETFRTAFREDAGEAFANFVLGLGKQGDAAFKTLDDLKLGNERVIRAFLSLANAGDLVTRSMTAAEGAWRENTALSEEAAKRFQTTASQLRLLWNSLKDVSITLGNAFLPVIRDVAQAVRDLTPALERWATAFAEMPRPVHVATAAMTALIVVTTPALLALGSMALAATQVSLAFGPAGVATKALGVVFGGASGLASLLASALTLLTGPVGLLIAAGAGILTLTGTWGEFGRILKAVASIITSVLIKALQGYIDNVRQALGWLRDLKQALTDHIPGLGLFADAVRDVAAGMAEVAEGVAATLKELPSAAQSLAERVGALKASLRDTGPALAQEDALNLLNQQLAESRDGFQRTRNASDALAGGMGEVDKALASARKELGDLSKVTRDELVKAIESGAFELEELKTMTGLSGAAIKLFSDELKTATDVEKEWESAIESLAGQLAGSGDDLRRLAAAWERLTPAQRDNALVVGRVLDAYEDLRKTATGQLPASLEALRAAYVAQQQGLYFVEQSVTDAGVAIDDFASRAALTGEVLQRIMLNVQDVEHPFRALAEAAEGTVYEFSELTREAMATERVMQDFANDAVRPSVNELEAFWRSLGYSEERIRALKDELTDTRAFGQFRDALSTVDDILGGINQAWAEMAVIAVRTLTAIVDRLAEGDIFGAVVAGVTGLGKALAGLFTNEDHERVNDMRDAFLETAGGLRAYHQTLVDTLGPQGEFLTRQILAAKTTEQYELAITRATEALEEHQRKLDRVSELVDSLGPSFNAIAAGVTITSDNIRDLGTIALASFGAMVEAGYSMQEAVAANKDGLLTLAETFIDLGINIEDVGLKAVLMQAQILDNNPALVAGIDALGQSMGALGDLGLLNIDTFGAMQRTGADMYRQLQFEVSKLGGETVDALAPMQGFLHEAEQRAKELGLPLDENLQLLIDQSKELGIWKEAGKTANELLLEGLERLVEKMDELVYRLTHIPDVDFDIRGHLQVPQLPGGEIPGFQHGSGGLRDFGAGTLAMLHGREAVIPEGQLNDVSGGRSLVLNVTFNNAMLDTPFGRSRTAEMISKATLDALRKEQRAQRV